MSESPFTSPPIDQAADTEAEPGGRRTAIVAGALGAVVLGAGAFFFLGGGDAPEQELAAPGAVPAAAAPAPSKSPTTLPVASTIELGRNPFKALYVAPAAAPAATAVTTAAPTTGGGTPSTGGTGTGGVPSTGGSTGGGSTGGGSTGGGLPPAPLPQPPATGGGQTPAPTAKQKLQLVSATHLGDDHTAVFSIDGVEHTVGVGDTFGPSKHLLLLSLQQGPRDDQWTAVVQLGDGDPFDVVTGSPVLVQ